MTAVVQNRDWAPKPASVPHDATSFGLSLTRTLKIMSPEPSHEWSSKDPALETPSEVGWRQLSLAGAIGFFLIAATALVSPYTAIKLDLAPGFHSAVTTTLIVVSFMLTTLLLIKGKIAQRGESIRLGGAYLFTSLIFLVTVASFPGTIVPKVLAGDPATPFWSWVFWHIGFGLWILHYAWAVRLRYSRKASLARTLGLAVVMAGIGALAAINSTYLLPLVFSNGHVVNEPLLLAIQLFLFLLSISAFVSVLATGLRDPEQLWVAVGVLAAIIDVWLHWQGGDRYTLGWTLAYVGSILISLTVLTSKVHELTMLYSTAAQNNKLLQALVHKDGLTGLSNRRRFDERLGSEFRGARRQSLPLGLILIDVDWFKSYNDTYGHLAGDECLRAIGGAISNVLHRAGDEVARYGGEELVVILTKTDHQGTITLAERMRAAVAALNIKHKDSVYGMVTISAGIAMLLSFDDGVGPSDLVDAADKALYQAKGSGRNKVCSLLFPDETTIAVTAA